MNVRGADSLRRFAFVDSLRGLAAFRLWSSTSVVRTRTPCSLEDAHWMLDTAFFRRARYNLLVISGFVIAYTLRKSGHAVGSSIVSLFGDSYVLLSTGSPSCWSLSSISAVTLGISGASRWSTFCGTNRRASGLPAGHFGSGRSCGIGRCYRDAVLFIAIIGGLGQRLFPRPTK